VGIRAFLGELPTHLRRARWFAGKALELVIEPTIFLCGISAIIFVFSIFLFIFMEGAPFLFNRFSFMEFFGSTRWIPEAAGKPSYGVVALILGSVAVSTIALSIAVPFGLGAAIYLSEFSGKRTKEGLKVIIELLAAIPSVVWGFIGITVMNGILIRLTGAPIGLNALNGGLVLALMIVPVIVSIGEDALRAVPDAYREAALALGATRWQITFKVLLPAAKNGLLAAVLLGVGRAVGETIAVLMCTGHSINIPFDLKFPFFHVLMPVRTLTATIAAEMGEAAKGSEHYQALFVLGMLLFIITFGINLIADVAVRGVRRR
jgi:phosphate transport system permease protein